MAYALALYTFGVFARPAEDPVNDGFYELNDPIMDRVDQAPGMIARSGYADEPGPESWGEEVYPPFYKESGDGWSPATLSLWTDMESAFAFSYFGLHASALKKGREWFLSPEWPPYAAWWCDRDHRPLWREAIGKHALLHERGPTPEAFNFKSPFDRDGDRVKIDMKRAREIAAA